MRRRRQHGFALLLVFAMMSAAAVMIYLQLPRFVMEAQRSKEQLLIDRGEQYQRAIQLYYRKMKTWPQSLDDLEKGNNTRFLRRRYLDPFTGKAEWRLVHVNNGIYTDSLVYNNDPNSKKEVRQTFVAEIPSIGTNAADANGPENVNRALQSRASDKSNDPLDSLPESLRAFVYRGSIATSGERPAYNADDDVQGPLPTPGVYGAQGLDISNLTPQQILAGAGTANQANDVGAPSPVPGVGGVSFEEIQRRMAEQAANGGGAAQQQPSIGSGSSGGFIGSTGGGMNTPYTPPPAPGAGGLSYTAIAGNNGNYAANNAPPVPGTTTGFPTGINPAAPAFGSSGGGFIGGSAPTQTAQQGQGQVGSFGQPSPGGAAGFGNPGQGRPQGFGNPGGGVGAPTGDAAALLNSALFGPRQQGAAGGTAVGGSGLVGVASKYKGETVKVYREKSRFQFWEFIYDPAKDTSGKGATGQQQLPGAPLPGGLPPGTAQQQGLGANPTQPLSGAGSGNRLGQQGQGTGSGFGNTGQTGGFGSTGSSPSSSGSGNFIGGPSPNTAPIPITPAPKPGTNQPTNTPPPTTRPGGGFIGGR